MDEIAPNAVSKKRTVVQNKGFCFGNNEDRDFKTPALAGRYFETPGLILKQESSWHEPRAKNREDDEPFDDVPVERVVLALMPASSSVLRGCIRDIPGLLPRMSIPS